MTMLKKIIGLILVGGFLFFFVQQQKGEEMVASLRDRFSQIGAARLPLPGKQYEGLRVVDPEVVAEAIKEDSSELATLFSHQTETALTLDAVVEETNNARIQEGLPPLKSNQLLIQSAEIKTRDMIDRHYFEHESPTGESVSDLGDRVEYPYIIMGENLALGNFKDAADLVRAWMESPGHRANILNPLYQEIGVYALRGNFEGQEVWFAVQHFGTNRNTCPSIDAKLRSDIAAMNAQLDIQEVEIERKKRELEEMNRGDDSYDTVVNEFNTMITTYNKLLGISQKSIVEYNKQVTTFNACLAKYQKE